MTTVVEVWPVDPTRCVLPVYARHRGNFRGTEISMNTSSRSTFVLAIALPVLAAAAHAAPQSEPAGGAATAQPPATAAPGRAEVRAAIAARMKALDSDGDDRLSAAEHDAIGQAAFARMDLDGNGNVSVAEIDRMRSAVGPAAQAMPTAAEVMSRVDGDGNGELSAAEHASGGQAMFGRMDADGDGYLTRAEMEAAHAAMSQAAD